MVDFPAVIFLFSFREVFFRCVSSRYWLQPPSLIVSKVVRRGCEAQEAWCRCLNATSLCSNGRKAGTWEDAWMPVESWSHEKNSDEWWTYIVDSLGSYVFFWGGRSKFWTKIGGVDAWSSLSWRCLLFVCFWQFKLGEVYLWTICLFLKCSLGTIHITNKEIIATTMFISWYNHSFGMPRFQEVPILAQEQSSKDILPMVHQVIDL